MSTFNLPIPGEYKYNMDQTELKLVTEFLDSGYAKIPRRQRQWHYDNSVFGFVYCKTCKTNKVGWSVKNKKYSTYCSSKCAHQDPDVRNKTEQTCLKKYGETTNLKTADNKNKVKQTLLSKYGVDNISKTEHFKNKFKRTCQERYGVDNPSQLASVREKIDKTHQKKYNRKRKSQVHINQKIIDLKNNKEVMYDWYHTQKMPLTEIAERLKVNHSQLCVHFKNNLGIDITRHRISWPENEIYQFVKSLDSSAYTSDRTILKPKEIDIVIPTKRLAIEYNGLSWHSEIRGNKGKLYHLSKTEKCEEQGYRMIHINSNEWNHNKEIVKSRLKNLLGYSKKIGARICEIKEVSRQDAEDFLETNHIQGKCVHKVAIGLYHNNILLALMTFGKPRFNKSIQYELLRYVNKCNYTVQGGASKCFKYFIKKHSPHSIISYSDRRWNTGNLYKKLGFEFVKTTEPNYWYTSDYINVENRMRYQKHKLDKILNNFDSAKTEWENMIDNGYDRIWDCGNSVWHWQKI